MLTLTMRGNVRERESRLGLGGLVVQAQTTDLLSADVLGSATTRWDGRFEILTEVDALGDLLPTKPQIHLRVFAPDGQTELHVVDEAAVWVGWRLGELEVEIPRKKLGDLAPLRKVRLMGDDGLERDSFEAGDSLVIEVLGVRPESLHEVIIVDALGEVLVRDRIMSNSFGVIERTTLWPQMGLDSLTPTAPVTVEQLEDLWRNRSFRIEVLGNASPIAAGARFADAFSRPLVIATDADGRRQSGVDRGEHEIVLSGFRMPFQGPLRVFMVPRQHAWAVGDPFLPVALGTGGEAVFDVDIDKATGGFRAPIAPADAVHPGAYDFIARELRYGYEDNDDLRLLPRDLVAHRQSTGLVVRDNFMAAKAVRGGCVNYLAISGRSVSGSPYFQYADTFQAGENIYAALDPTAIAPEHQGKMVALYVVAHKSPAQWSVDKSLHHLEVLGGNAAVQKFQIQSGCINFNKRLLWPGANEAGEYDIVADFGNNAADPDTFSPDDSFDSPLDIIDGYFVGGFRVVPDPGVDASFPHAGQFEYDQSTEGSITVVDDYGQSVTVPLRAVVYFPADEPGATNPVQISSAQVSYPLVVLVHANRYADSVIYKGFNYLLEHLARNGFIAASIHLERGQRGTDRARVLFKHLEILKGKFGLKAANNVGLMGHSRGGEAVVIAARLNHQETLGHQINAVISLAPSDQYTFEKFGGPWAAPYLVIYGAMDADLPGQDNTGFSLFDRASDARKSMAFVYGGLHGPWNTVMGDYDAVPWLRPDDQPHIISSEAHQQIAKAYMTPFFRQHLKGETQWEGIFRGDWVPASVQRADPPKVRIYMQYIDTEKTVVDNFEGPHAPIDWQTSTIGGTVSHGDSLPTDPLEEHLPKIDDHSPHDTSGLLLRWDAAGDFIRFDVPSEHKDFTSFDFVNLPVTQKVKSPSNPDGPQDLYLTLADSSGKSRAVRVGKFAEIPQPQRRQHEGLTKSAMRTIRIPLHAFTVDVLEAEPIDLRNVKSVMLEFAPVPTGEVAIDSLEFTK